MNTSDIPPPLPSKVSTKDLISAKKSLNQLNRASFAVMRQETSRLEAKQYILEGIELV